MYIQYQASKELGIDKRNVLLYALSVLYILSTATVALDLTHLAIVGKICTHHNKFSVYI